MESEVSQITSDCNCVLLLYSFYSLTPSLLHWYGTGIKEGNKIQDCVFLSYSSISSISLLNIFCYIIIQLPLFVVAVSHLSSHSLHLTLPGHCKHCTCTICHCRYPHHKHLQKLFQLCKSSLPNKSVWSLYMFSISSLHPSLSTTTCFTNVLEDMVIDVWGQALVELSVILVSYWSLLVLIQGSHGCII